MPGDVRQRLGELQARPAVPGEPVRAPEQVAGELLVVGHFLGRRLAVVLGEHRLGVEQIDVARAAVHEELDDGLGPRGVVRGAGPDVKRPASGRRCLGPQPVDSPRSAASDHPAEAAAQARQGLAASQAQRASGRAIGSASEVPRSGQSISIHVRKLVRAQEHLAEVGERQAPATRALGGRRFGAWPGERPCVAAD